jgi:2-polyprenyl-3-methyl-5-hydroxy-6-metoxy-1,4-benzoquinol methylase
VINFQESYYDESVDYRHGSPHLAHLHVYDRLVGIALDEVNRLAETGRPLKVLELGAGHGGYTEPMLAAGCHVTAVEMSRPSLDYLEKRFAHNRGFAGAYCPDADIAGLESDYSLVLCVAVLHHIPDYMAAIRDLVDHLAIGGTMLFLQDPLWYPRADKRALALNTVGYAAWRITQGNLSQALRTGVRRLSRSYDDSNPSDMVEYHVVRQGVDENEIVTELRGQFEHVELLPYWTNQSAIFQRIGELARLVNTFGVIARSRTIES